MRRAIYPLCALTLFPLMLAAFIALYLRDEAAYRALLDEDALVEWATVVFLVTAAALALLRTRRDPAWRFYAALAAFLVLAVLEELSWGQRLLGIDSPAFFVGHSDQQEINLHNVFQRWSGVTTKWVAALVLSAYGIALPISARHLPALRVWATRWHVVVPPRVLVPGFLLGALLMVDLPTYEEEEIAELFFALCFVLLVLCPSDPDAVSP